MGLIPINANALKIEALAGAYSLTAEVGATKYSKTGLGSYRIGLLIPMIEKVDLSLSYNLNVSGVVTGDYGYGFDMGLDYYPLSYANSSTVFNDESRSVIIQDTWKPFVGLYFSQRQFQSVRASYAGFSLGGGFEKSWNSNFSLKFMIKGSSLAGPSKSTSVLVDGLAGLVFSY